MVERSVPRSRRKRQRLQRPTAASFSGETKSRPHSAVPRDRSALQVIGDPPTTPWQERHNRASSGGASRRTVTTPGCEKAHSPPRCRVPVSQGSNNRSGENSFADVQDFFKDGSFIHKEPELWVHIPAIAENASDILCSCDIYGVERKWKIQSR